MGEEPKPLERLQYLDISGVDGTLQRLRRERAEKLAASLYVKGPGEATAVHHSDVVQGQHPNCFAVAALAAVVKAHPDPDRFLREMIKPKGDGSFDVTIHVFGPGDPARGVLPGLQPTTVNVFPDTVWDPAHSDEHEEIWPSIVEKAYAQSCPVEDGNDAYGFKGGSPAMAMASLTGLPSETLSAGTLTMDTLADYQAKGYAITVTTHPKSAAGSPLEPVNMLPEYANEGLAGGDLDRLPERVPAHDHNHMLRPWHVYYVKSVDAASGTVTIHNVWDEGREDIQMPYDRFQLAVQQVDVNPVRSRARPH